MKFLYLIILSLFITNPNFGQNNSCLTAMHISDANQYCSGNGEFNTQNAGDSGIPRGSCWPDQGNDLWFTFTPTELAFVIQLFAEGNNGNINNPSVVVYTGNCSNLIEVGCSSVLTGLNEIEITETDIVIGQLYYIRIDARNGQVGSFKLCVDVFTPVPIPQADCKDGVVLCNKDPFVVESIIGTGDDNNEIEPGNCIEQEFASVWYKWTCDQSGTLDFDLIPNNPSDDLDFVVYRLPNGLDDCSGKIRERCMASGETIGAGIPTNSPCVGATGLRPSSVDITEDPGCGNNSDNYIRSLDMVSGESYVLIVNNFSKSGFGFAINFGGTGTFLGPEAHFDFLSLEEFECDKTIRFTDLSSSLTDQIESYTWRFGAGASPQLATGKGPHDVIYDSFGDKIVALTIESSRGCLVTKLIPIYVESCCADVSTLDLDAQTTDPSCFNINDGTIMGIGIAGDPPYQFSLDGVNYQENPYFYNLGEGSYDLYIQDKKGCEHFINVQLNAPPPLVINAGPDTTVNLGDIIEFYASYSPISSTLDISWNPTSGFQSCDDCLNPEVQSHGTTAYVITGVDQNGCIDMDTIIVTTEIVRPVIAPTIITIDSNDGNGNFFISVGPASDYIKKVLIYDRWGNLVYDAYDIYKDTPFGWDGRFKGEPVVAGVFTWVAEVHFLDDVTLSYTGDVTVLR